MRLRVAGLFFASILSLVISAAAFAADPAPAPTPADCEYIAGDGVARPDIWSRTLATEVEVKGCRPQCVARVYCASDHPKTPPAQVTLQQKIERSKLINCNANPEVTIGTSSCPPPDECNRAVRAESFRVARPVAPRKGLPQYVAGNGQMYDVRYGLDSKVAHAPATLYAFPKSNGEFSASSCHVCASPASLGEGVKRFLVCPAKGGPKNWSCDSGNDCATTQDTAGDGELSAAYVSEKHIEHVEPLGPDGLPRGTSAGGAVSQP